MADTGRHRTRVARGKPNALSALGPREIVDAVVTQPPADARTAISDYRKPPETRILATGQILTRRVVVAIRSEVDLARIAVRAWEPVGLVGDGIGVERRNDGIRTNTADFRGVGTCTAEQPAHAAVAADHDGVAAGRVLTRVAETNHCVEAVAEFRAGARATCSVVMRRIGIDHLSGLLRRHDHAIGVDHHMPRRRTLDAGARIKTRAANIDAALVTDDRTAVIERHHHRPTRTDTVLEFLHRIAAVLHEVRIRRGPVDIV